MRPGINKSNARDVFGLLSDAGHYAFEIIERNAHPHDARDANEIESTIDLVESLLMDMLRVDDAERNALVSQWRDREGR